MNLKEFACKYFSDTWWYGKESNEKISNIMFVDIKDRYLVKVVTPWSVIYSSIMYAIVAILIYAAVYFPYCAIKMYPEIHANAYTEMGWGLVVLYGIILFAVGAFAFYHLITNTVLYKCPIGNVMRSD